MRAIGIGFGLAALVCAAPVAAVEPEAFLERLRAAYAFMGYDFEFGPARAEGDAIIIDGASVSISQPEGTFGPADLDVELRFAGVTETSDGAYTAQALTIGELAFEHDTGDETLAFSVDGVRMTDFYLPPGEVRALDSITLFSDLETGRLTFTQDGMEVFSVGAMLATSAFNPPPGEGELVDLSSHLALEDVTIHTGPNKADAKTSRAILGEPSITGRIDGTVTWSMENGRLSLEPLRIAFDEQGSLDLDFTFEGMTADVLQTIYETDRRVSELMDKGKMQGAQEVQMQAGIALLEKLQLVSARVRYEDATLASRLLAYFARRQGAEPTAYAEGLANQLELTLSNARAPELAQTIVEQARRFLSDPQSFEIAIAPDTPLRLITAVSAAVNPAGLANMLKLSVTANGGTGAGDDAVR